MIVPLQRPEFFQSYLNKQRKDKFVLVLTLPEILKSLKTSKPNRSNSTIIPDTLQFSVYGSVVPDISIPEVEVPYGGQVMKVSSLVKPSFPKNTVNFTVDNLFGNYWVIYKWLQILHDEKTAIYDSNIKNDIGLLKNYETNISVFGLDEYNNRVIEFKYLHAFPVTLGGITYSDRDSKEMESTFEYAYHQFEAKLL